MGDTIKLRIKPGTVELPHTISKGGAKYEFKPSCDVPAGLGEALLRTHPNLYELSDGKDNLDDYAFKKTFQTQTVHDLLKTLTEDELVDVYEYAQGVIAKRAKNETEETGDVETPTAPAAPAAPAATAAPKPAQKK